LEPGWKPCSSSNASLVREIALEPTTKDQRKMADKLVELLAIEPMLCATGGTLIVAGILLTFFESVWRRGRTGLVLVAMGAVLLIVAALTTQQPA
jgi:hypothetical protein